MSSSYQIAKKASELAFSKKAEDILIIEIRDLTSIADYFVICTANSAIHAKAGYDIMFDSGYGGEHWLATFAVYMMSEYDRLN